MLSHPKRWLNESEFSISLTSQGVGRVALAMKNHNSGIVWNLWWRPVVVRPTRNAVIFETWAPLGWPIGELALLVHKV
jgi:hypothetical protein